MPPAARIYRPAPFRVDIRFLPHRSPRRRYASHPTAARALVLGLCVLAGSCCDLGSDGPPPFIYHGVRVVTGRVEGCHDAIGVYYDIQNTSDKAFTGMEASFYLFDGDGGAAPRAGANYFSARYDEVIPAGVRREVCSSLDHAFFFAPDTPPHTKHFRISRVCFEDGSIWQDLLRLYEFPGESEAETREEDHTDE